MSFLIYSIYSSLILFFSDKYVYEGLKLPFGQTFFYTVCILVVFLQYESSYVLRNYFFDKPRKGKLYKTNSFNTTNPTMPFVTEKIDPQLVLSMLTVRTLDNHLFVSSDPTTHNSEYYCLQFVVNHIYNIRKFIGKNKEFRGILRFSNNLIFLFDLLLINYYYLLFLV